jgi:hypothetical protein
MKGLLVLREFPQVIRRTGRRLLATITPSGQHEDADEPAAARRRSDET